MSMTWEEKKELIHSRRKEMFPKLRERWVFSDIHCNRGSNRSLGVPSALDDLVKWVESIRTCDFGMDTLINAIFYKISKGEVSPNNMEKLDRFLKPFFKKHRKFLKDHPEWKEEDPCQLCSDSKSSRKWARSDETYFDTMQMH